MFHDLNASEFDRDDAMSVLVNSVLSNWTISSCI